MEDLCIKEVTRMGAPIMLAVPSPARPWAKPYLASVSQFGPAWKLEIFRVDLDSNDKQMPVVAESSSVGPVGRVCWGSEPGFIAAGSEYSEHENPPWAGPSDGLEGLVQLWKPGDVLENNADRLSVENKQVIDLGAHRGHWGRRVVGLDFHPWETNLLASGGHDGRVAIWDVDQCYDDRNFETHLVDVEENEAKSIFFLSWSWSADGCFLGTASFDGIGVWDTRNLYNPYKRLTDKDRRSTRVSVFQWDPRYDKDLIAGSATDDGFPSLRLWDTRYPDRHMGEFEGYTSGILAMSWCPDRPFLLTCGEDGRTICWDVKSAIEFAFELPVVATNKILDVHWCTSDEKPGLIAASFSDGTIGIYNIEDHLQNYMANGSGSKDD